MKRKEKKTRNEGKKRMKEKKGEKGKKRNEDRSDVDWLIFCPITLEQCTFVQFSLLLQSKIEMVFFFMFVPSIQTIFVSENCQNNMVSPKRKTKPSQCKRDSKQTKHHPAFKTITSHRKLSCNLLKLSIPALKLVGLAMRTMCLFSCGRRKEET